MSGNNSINTIDTYLKQYENSSNTSSCLIIKFNTNGKYHMFETSNYPYRGCLLGTANSSPDNIYSVSNWYCKTSNIICHVFYTLTLQK